jgi:hypothetical protein
MLFSLVDCSQAITHAYVSVLFPNLSLFSWSTCFSFWPGGKKDIVFDCYREDDFFNQPGFGDGVASLNLCADPYFDPEADTWESGTCLEVTSDAGGYVPSIVNFFSFIKSHYQAALIFWTNTVQSINALRLSCPIYSMDHFHPRPCFPCCFSPLSLYLFGSFWFSLLFVFPFVLVSSVISFSWASQHHS